MDSKFIDVHDYYTTLISIANVTLPLERTNKLTKKEVKFLADCCTYHYQGKSLERFSMLSKYVVDNGTCKNAREVSFYKTRLGAKKWIKAARDTFDLPKLLLDPKQTKTFNIVYAGK